MRRIGYFHPHCHRIYIIAFSSLLCNKSNPSFYIRKLIEDLLFFTQHVFFIRSASLFTLIFRYKKIKIYPIFIILLFKSLIYIYYYIQSFIKSCIMFRLGGKYFVTLIYGICYFNSKGLKLLTYIWNVIVRLN